MTILVSTMSKELIVMLSDSTETTHLTDEHGNHHSDEYKTVSKFYTFPGVGCITAWGDRTYNRLGGFLQERRASRSINSVHDLVELTHTYIRDLYRKEEYEELGFHVGGFDKSGKPHLHHIFWGFDQPKQDTQKAPKVRNCDNEEGALLYNGRNDLANVVIDTLKKQIQAGKEIRFDLSTPIGLISLCDFIARFAAEMTPQVGPPFVINLIFPDNSIERIENTSLGPISLHSVASVLPKLLTPKPPDTLPYIGYAPYTLNTAESDNPQYINSGGTAEKLPPQKRTQQSE